MKKLITLIISVCVLFLLDSCGSAKKGIRKRSESKPPELQSVGGVKSSSKEIKNHITSLSKSGKSLNSNTLNYIDQFSYAAMGQMKSHKIPASITLAQGILESGNGKSELAMKSKNHFGIKCHKGWNGPSVRYDDDEKNECFRKYSDVSQSYNDHAEFLKGRSRYAFLFDYKIDDYKKWAKGLKKAGYATDKKYPTKLIKIIEDYELYALDKMVLKGKVSSYSRPESEVVKSEIKQKPVILPKQHIVKPGETLYAISKMYGFEIAHLKWLNGLSSNNLFVGQILSLKDKVDAPTKPAERVLMKAESHVVQKGETLYAISRMYGLKVEDIVALNNLEVNVIEIGQVLSVKMSQDIVRVENAVVDTKEEEPISDEDFFIYEVGKGDNLYNISKKNNVQIDDIKTWNVLTSNNISLGQKLKIKRTLANNPVSKKEHTVAKGDTLFKIAKTYQMSVDELMKLNQLEHTNLFIGQVLKLNHKKVNNRF